MQYFVSLPLYLNQSGAWEQEPYFPWSYKINFSPLLLTCCRVCSGLHVDYICMADRAQKCDSGRSPPCRFHSEAPDNLAYTHTALWSGCSDSHPRFQSQSNYMHMLQKREGKRHYWLRFNVFLIKWTLFFLSIHDNFVRMGKIYSSSNLLSTLLSLFKLGNIYSKVHETMYHS